MRKRGKKRRLVRQEQTRAKREREDRRRDKEEGEEAFFSTIKNSWEHKGTALRLKKTKKIKNKVENSNFFFVPFLLSCIL